MPLNSGDRFYRAENTAPSVKRLGSALCAAYGRPADAFGAKGNLTHWSGYHRSRAWILGSPDSRYGARDYSVLQALDRGGSDDDIAAADFTPADWGSARNRRLMREITGRVHAAAKARDPRLANWREFAGTLDGRTVATFNCADGSAKSPFDITHLDHVHASGWRSRIRNDHTGLLHVMTGVPAGATSREDDVMFLANLKGTLEVWLTNGLTARWVTAEELPHLLALHQEGTQPLTNGGRIREVAYQSMVGAVAGPRPVRLGVDEETAAIVAAVRALHVELSDEDLRAIIEAPNNRLTVADLPLLVEASKQATREGTA